MVTYHNTENRPKDGICVANHTSPIDVVMLASDTAYALVSTLYSEKGVKIDFFYFISADRTEAWRVSRLSPGSAVQGFISDLV